MMPALVILGVVVLVPMLWVMVGYNTLVSLRMHVRESWAGIDTELQRRYDLIPNLVRTVQGYAAHEKGVLESVTEARAKAVASTGNPASQARDENHMIRSLRQLFAVSEGYPELKASVNFMQLQKELVNTEDRIAAARRFYNGNVRDLNTRVEMWPWNIVAGMFHFQAADFFEIEDSSVRAMPDVQFSS